MPTLQELREQRANVWAQMTEIMERSGGAPSGEDAAAYDRAEGDLDRLGSDIERVERFDTARAAMERIDRSGVVGGDREDTAPDARGEVYNSAFSRFIRAVNGISDLGDQDRRALRDGYVQGDQFRNAAGVSTGAAGGYTVPPAFRNRIVEAMLAYGPMLQLAELVETDSGVNLPWPTNDDTANEGAILAENSQITEQDLTLGTASLDAYTYTSKLVRVSWQLMQDSPDFEGFLARKLGERLARIYNRHATVGTGSAQPDGIVQSSTVAVTGSGSLATTGGVSYDNLVDLVESIDDAYLAGEQRWMMHQSVRKAVRKLKDSQNRPLWEPSVQAGQPDTLLGYPISINNHMATVAQNAKSLGFGNVREAYVVRIVRSNELVRLNERYADYLQTGFFGFGRLDATMQNTAAFKVMQLTPTA